MDYACYYQFIAVQIYEIKYNIPKKKKKNPHPREKRMGRKVYQMNHFT